MASIRQEEPAGHRLLPAVDEAHTLTAILLAVWPLARVLAMPIGAAGRAERALSPPCWPRCPTGGACLRRKGCVKRPVLRLCGAIGWRRRVGRGPQGGAIPPVAPWEEALGVRPAQRTRAALPSLGCALAVCVPCATAARWRRWESAGSVRAQAVGAWGQAAGRRALAQRHAPRHAGAPGHRPPEEPRPAQWEAAALRMGAEGVRGPLRPAGGQPRGTTAWHAVNVGVWARWGPPRTRPGTVVARLQQRRRGAVVGARDALPQRLGLAALR
jgi:hypothetical protein